MNPAILPLDSLLLTASLCLSFSSHSYQVIARHLPRSSLVNKPTKQGDLMNSLDNLLSVSLFPRVVAEGPFFFLHRGVFFFCGRNSAGAEKSRSGLQIQRHSYKDLAGCMAASIFAAISCFCLFIVVKLNGQNFKYSSPSSSETQETIERAAEHVPGSFYLLWTTGGGGRGLG